MPRPSASKPSTKRGVLHNESAELLKTSLADKVRLDDDTARRLFTLISVLQMRG